MNRVALLIAFVVIAVVEGGATHGSVATVSVGAAVAELPVSFDVVNKNDSSVACPSDGAEYVVKGHLVGPRSELFARAQRERAVTVVLTGMDEGEWAVRFKDVAGYDYALEMGRLGHVSLALDMLGYDTSGRPHGFLSCWGSQADVTHQIVQQLRAGTYRFDDPHIEAAPFATVLLKGRDVGGFIAVLEAHTWKDVDAVVTFLPAHQGATPYILDIIARRSVACALGGQDYDDPPDNPDDPSDDPSHGGGYVLFGPPDDDFREDLFDEDRADPRVIDAVIRQRNRNPCGYIPSISTTVRINLQRMSEIDVPVLLLFPGPDDPVFTREGQEQEAANYKGSDDVTTAWIDGGHFVELEECAHALRAFYARWVHDRFGSGEAIDAPAVGPDQCVTEVRTK